ncbi:MAG: serine/threonine-protein phosphatase [Eubacterium sp.]|nr:serine/threonine-protein phosphatase [Eubacterium sp.]
MKADISYYSAIGGRKNNEDAVLVRNGRKSALCIVADGLGGHSGGEIASKKAVCILNEELGHKRISVKSMQTAIEHANEAVYQDKQNYSMKSTIAVLWMKGNCAVAATAGDTRIYQFRNDRIIYQSKDHSIAYLEALSGKLNGDSIRRNKTRNQLTRALGAQDTIQPDILMLDSEPGDAFLICSDGFWEHVWEEDMAEGLFASQTAAEWLDGMRRRVENKVVEHADNHSAVAVLLERI